jgi:signal transduction histidine kinase
LRFGVEKLTEVIKVYSLAPGHRSVVKPLLPRASHRLTRAAGLLLIVVGAIVLSGWILGIEILQTLFGPIGMKANTAVALLLVGTAVRLLSESSRTSRGVGAACGLLASAIGGATFSQHLFGWDLGIDQLLFTELPGAVATTSPGRMGPNASLCLTMAGLALGGLFWGTYRTVAWAQVLGAAVTSLALIPTVGYLYGTRELYAIARYTGIAFHTALSLLVLGITILAAQPDKGPVAAVLSDAPHGIMARRLLAVTIGFPLVLGFAYVVGERNGWYDVVLGSSIFVVAMVVLFSLTIWRTAVALARTSADLKRAEQDRTELLSRERAARQKAEQADRAKDEFIAALSHELRTPLNAILGWMYMLRHDTVPEAARGKAAEAVVRNAGLLARLIEDLLDTSRISTGHLALTRSPTDLKAVAQAAIESVLPASEGKGIHIHLEAAPRLPKVVGDAQRLQQVVWNLLSNSIKFSPPGADVRVRLRTEIGAVVVSVADDGEGIDPAFLPYIFERFQQADSTQAREQGGLGLGLYIARHLTELHGGTLHAYSPGPGKGATLTMRIPPAPEASAAPAGVSV